MTNRKLPSRMVRSAQHLRKLEGQRKTTKLPIHPREPSKTELNEIVAARREVPLDVPSLTEVETRANCLLDMR